jgi:thiol-disulfide isomerase/thioredoxin
MKIRNCVAVGLLMLSQWAAAEVSGTAPDFSLQGMEGKMINLADYQGKVVYVDFWASWCSPCRDSFPWMSAMQKKYESQGVVFIGVNVDRKQLDAEKFLKDTPAQFVVAFDPKGKTPKAYDVMGMPTAFLISRDGKVLHSHIGFNDNDKVEYEKHIQQALAQ